MLESCMPVRNLNTIIISPLNLRYTNVGRFNYFNLSIYDICLISCINLVAPRDLTIDLYMAKKLSLFRKVKFLLIIPRML